MASGVRGIKLFRDDYVIGIAREKEGSELLTVTENGFGKRTLISAYTEHHRGGYGMTAHNITEKTGKLAGIRTVTPMMTFS